MAQQALASASLLILLFARGVLGATAAAEGRCEDTNAMMDTVLLQFDTSEMTHDSAGADSLKGIPTTASTTVQLSDDRMSAGQWSLIGPDRICAFFSGADAEKYLGSGMSASECQAAALADTDCGLYVWGNGNYCDCKRVGFGCDLQTTSVGHWCYDLQTTGCNVYMYQTFTTTTFPTPAPVATALSSPVSAGDTTLPVASTVGFSVGCTVAIEGGGNSETGDVASIGSLVLTSGLTHSYPAGTTTVTLTATAAPTPAPTPAPTSHLPSTAVGDPHVTNLIGESFDINEPGEHVLLRMPRDASVPPQLEVRASMRPAPGSPCGLWITEVILGGEWVGEGEIHVHTSNQGSADGTSDHFALLWSSAGAPMSRRWRPWAEFGKNVGEVLSSNVTVRPTFRAFQGAAAVRDRRIFEFLIGPAPTMDKRLSIVVAQASRRAALDVQATRLGMAGFGRFGGLLGTEEHDPAVEELSSECRASSSAASSSSPIKHSGWEHVVADSADSSAQAWLLSDSGHHEMATIMTASW